MSGTSIEAVSIAATQDRTLASLADREVDHAGSTGKERDRCRLVALAEDAQCSMTPFEAEVLDVGRARLAHPHPVQPQQHREGGVLAVVLLGSEQEHGELGAV